MIITALNKKTCLLGAFKKSIFKEKCGTFRKSGSVKETLSANNFFEKI